MYNKYELLWLWYYYHTEKADLLICTGLSPDGDEDCRFPITNEQRRLSNVNAMNNYKIIKEIVGNSYILNDHKKKFSRFKNAQIFKEYEILDERGYFDFIHDFVEQILKLQKEKQKYEKQQSLRLLEESIFYDKY